ncbi:hypothetical protein ERO13_D03G091300v2 [Gossypium hirsutum]|uniref:Pectate lyase n=5 Tax=Gossypium TaxID=3633 RepID=A0A1U8NTI9_GOSHI|nr:pectate lyase-like [Gossypium hirsutum]KAB2037933.1 hypothetical protein ES319_D03G109800v1 [Gossypium barbadense]TYG76499.1 hypothetical protein ES288_D03G119200v1 [Gossypium darwinii]TYH80194.1 hypothetical protein ES332_D03G115100v1 [Gossypium tomentosum]TYI90197.1 hypothetical protein E1A91_D03G104400v1 [Gossypium mustelinum]KAG4155099.1 hypothetical protein ERO13_D03G091300v2 [Gossypium hirsutum]
MKVVKIILALGLIVIANSGIVMANIAHFDEVWAKRAQRAKQIAEKAYDPNPHHVANHLNHKTHQAHKAHKRDLKKQGENKKKESKPRKMPRNV